ncbi:exported hypothetical protein [Vibrio coralliirubri]|uniref:Uncharacterized protein n=1 Tax=Vibrio coralliirubri TaxID=1516159 RepID=A0AA86WPM8_9VIBR|nr:exported hypothetical protein [Vibrio coralliirubri]
MSSHLALSKPHKPDLIALFTTITAPFFISQSSLLFSFDDTGIETSIKQMKRNEKPLNTTT